MEHERPRDRRLGRNLQRNRPSRKRGSHGGARKGKSDKWADKVGEAEDVETAGHKRAGDAVESRGVPGYLRAVDGEVGGCWAVATLLNEDFVGVFWGNVLGCDGSVEAVLVYAVSQVFIIGCGGMCALMLERAHQGTAEAYLVWMASGAACLDASCWISDGFATIVPLVYIPPIHSHNSFIQHSGISHIHDLINRVPSSISLIHFKG